MHTNQWFTNIWTISLMVLLGAIGLGPMSQAADWPGLLVHFQVPSGFLTDFEPGFLMLRSSHDRIVVTRDERPNAFSPEVGA